MNFNFKLRGMLVALIVFLAIGLASGIFSTRTDAQSGSSLIINATATPLNGSLQAQPNNVNSAAVYVTVQSSSGLVTGLEGSDFTIFAEELPLSGCRVSNINIRSNNPGVYRVDIVPGNAGCTWERGLYVLSVSVNNGSQSGAALAELQID